MKKFLLFGLPALALSMTLFSFAPGQNYGVVVDEVGNYQIAPKNSITQPDKDRFVQDIRDIYGIKGEEDFTTEMQAMRGFTRRAFIGKIKILSNFEEYAFKEETTTAAASPAQLDAMKILQQYSTGGK